MLLVKTYIGQSQISGIGLFADQFIPAGEPVWGFKEGFDLVIGQEQLKQLSASAIKQVKNYAYLSSEDNFVLCADDARFINHSFQSNTIDDESEKGLKYAKYDIQRGQEITSDYSVFDKSFTNRFESGII